MSHTHTNPPRESDLLAAADTLAQYARHANSEGWPETTEILLYVTRMLNASQGASVERTAPDLSVVFRPDDHAPEDVVGLLRQYRDSEAVAQALVEYIDAEYPANEGLELAAYKYRNRDRIPPYTNPPVGNNDDPSVNTGHLIW